MSLTSRQKISSGTSILTPGDRLLIEALSRGLGKGHREIDLLALRIARRLAIQQASTTGLDAIRGRVA